MRRSPQRMLPRCDVPAPSRRGSGDDPAPRNPAAAARWAAGSDTRPGHRRPARVRRRWILPVAAGICLTCMAAWAASQPTTHGCEDGADRLERAWTRAHLDEVKVRLEQADPKRQRCGMARRTTPASPSCLPTFFEVANFYSGRGVALKKQGRYDEARKDYEHALDVMRKSVGTDAPQVAMLLANLGNLAKRTGDPDEALELHQQALAIREGRRWARSAPKGADDSDEGPGRGPSLARAVARPDRQQPPRRRTSRRGGAVVSDRSEAACQGWRPRKRCRLAVLRRGPGRACSGETTAAMESLGRSLE